MFSEELVYKTKIDHNDEGRRGAGELGGGEEGGEAAEGGGGAAARPPDLERR